MKTVPTVLLSVALLVPALVAPASAEDPKPAPPGEKAPDTGAEAKDKPVERKTTPEALAALEKHGSMVHGPSAAGLTSLESKASATGFQMIDSFDITQSWSAKGGFDVVLTLKESVKDSVPKDSLPMMKMVAGAIKNQLKTPLAMLFDSPQQTSRDYDVGHKEKNGKFRVVMVPVKDRETAWERQTLYFDDTGLVRRIVAIPRVDPNDPQMGMLAGTELEFSFTYGKKGERFRYDKVEFMSDFGVIDISLDYYDTDDGMQYPKSITAATQMSPEPIVVEFFDYKANGKSVPATSKKVVTKSSGEAQQPEEGANGGDDTK